jgi:hypothetical protein
MDYTNICDIINNYLIDKEININENDTFINKLKFFLLKYKRIIAIVLLIILLFIGYQCNLTFLDINPNLNPKLNPKLNPNQNPKQNLYNLKGGDQGVIAGKINSAVSSIGDTLKDGKVDALKTGASESYDFAARRADDYKSFAPKLYGFIYSVAISVLMFLIFMPAVGFFIVGIICYSILKDKMGYIKSL